MNFEFELTATPITSNAGLAFVGQQLNEEKFDRHLAHLCPHQRNKGRISDGDIAKTMVGLICVGKPAFDAADEYKDDPYFPRALGLARLPSAAILRQRIQGMPAAAGQAFRGFTRRGLAAYPGYLSEQIHGKDRCVIHIDVSPMDNSGSNKEGVSCTYRKFDGYAPIFAYIGPHGFMIDNQLRPGKRHCNCSGTTEWLERVLEGAGAAAPEDIPRVVVTDAGHDAADNLLLFAEAQQTDFVVKKNLRTSDPADWLAEARRQSGPEDYQQPDPGARRWYGERTVEVSCEDQTIALRQVWRATERTADADGQLLVEPQITIDAYWTSLEWTPAEIQAFYQQRGTSEQFHSEFKTDLALERLPSGKLATNQHILNLGMMAYNLLRLLGQQMLGSGLVPGRKAQSKRLRLRSVMQNLIYMAGRVVRHARRRILRIFEGHGWAPVVMAMARGPD